MINKFDFLLPLLVVVALIREFSRFVALILFLIHLELVIVYSFWMINNKFDRRLLSFVNRNSDNLNGTIDKRFDETALDLGIPSS